jgi:LysM repeat protein
LKGRRIPRALLALCLLLPAASWAAQEAEERPKIFLEKKVYSDTVGGKRSFYETHIVEKGDSLWKILERRKSLTPERYAERLKEFRRANPEVADPSRLSPGQKILVPSGEREEPPADGRSVAYTVKKGDSLSGILASRGVPRKRLKDYLDAVREINPSIRDVNLIYAGKTVRLPTEGYFAEIPTSLAAVDRSESPEPAEAPSAPLPEAASAPPPADTLTDPTLPVRDAPPVPGPDTLAAAKPQAELIAPKAPAPEASFLETGKREQDKDKETVTAPAVSPYRGLLSDLFNALGEKWIERGTLFLPLSSGEELVLLLSEYPLVRFQGGREALIDFRGGLPPRVREAVTGSWKHIRVVSLDGARGAGEMIERILRVSGYHSVKEGLSRPVVIGETVSVVLPASWIIQRTEESLLSDDLVLVKETPEKPSEELAAVLRYAQRVGVRVLPYADDPKAMEGFLVGIEEEDKAQGIPVALVVPEGGGLPAVDFALNFLGISPKEGERLRIGGKGGAFQLVIQPERVFELEGRKHVVDTGKMSDAIRSILKDSGHTVFHVGKNDSGREIFERLVKTAGGAVGNRREHLLSGGGDAGYAVRLTGSILSLPPRAGGEARKAVLVRGKAHSATRALLRDLGVEIVEW